MTRALIVALASLVLLGQACGEDNGPDLPGGGEPSPASTTAPSATSQPPAPPTPTPLSLKPLEPGAEAVVRAYVAARGQKLIGRCELVYGTSTLEVCLSVREVEANRVQVSIAYGGGAAIARLVLERTAEGWVIAEDLGPATGRP